jgi:hypothetical protein
MNSTRRQALFLLGLLAAAPPWTRALAAARDSDDDDDPAGPYNVFISPCGQPFRAPQAAPYPIDVWFKQADANSDGKLDRAEFVADAAAFFKKLDLRGEGVLSPAEIAIYEHRIAPEVLGLHVKVSLGDRPVIERDGGRLWLAQADKPGEIDPGGTIPNNPDDKPKAFTESGQGASPYSLFDEPEPVTAADLDFNGFIRRVNFLKVADAHFTTLDPNDKGFLTLAGLPMTPVQKELAAANKKRKRS